MALTALILYAVWLVLGFGWRAVAQQRRTGDTGMRGLSGRPGSAAWWAGVLFAVALVTGLAAPIASLAGVPPLPGLDHTAIAAPGIAITLLGIVATLVSQTEMGSAWRVGVRDGERTELVTRGPFAAVRNPVFTAMIITAVGLAAITGSLIAVLGVAALITAVELQVRVIEEPHLVKLHGATYLEYAARAGRFLPGIGRGTHATGRVGQ